MATTSRQEPSRNRPVGSPAVQAPPAAPAATSPADLYEEPHEDHGHSVAAWTSVSVVMLGCLIMSIAVVVAVVWLFVLGAVVVVVGAVLAKLLSAMGYGSAGRSTH